MEELPPPPLEIKALNPKPQALSQSPPTPNVFLADSGQQGGHGGTGFAWQRSRFPAKSYDVAGGCAYL